jgi:TolB-like protein/DNA-binding winged helix-turn-helix (wHTH) protein/Flp pilus assembly protein TadD
MVSKPIAAPSKFRFGEDFELDVRAFALCSAGIPLKLKPIAMELLLLLVERRGELITREQIVERIWGKGVFLDTDNSINGAISKIRQVLRDDAEKPRYVQTVSGRGYRFIAPVLEAGALSTPEVAVSQPSPRAERSIGREGSRDRILQPRVFRRRFLPLLGILVVLVVLGAYWHWSRSRSQEPVPSGARLMLAVLPFENLTGDAGQDYFSDGMTEEMITQLGNLDAAHLGVIARTSVMHYKHSQEPLDQIGDELGVQYVLEGSVRRDSDRVRITAQLIQLKDQSHLWARQYDRELSHLLALQGEIAHEISGEIQTALGTEKAIPPPIRQSLSPHSYEAYDLYLRGQYFWNKRTIEGFERAIDYYQLAIAKEPNYARAYAGLADSYSLLTGYSMAPPSEYMPRARAAALRALELDESLPEAHTALALIVQNYDYDWQTAEKEFRRAIELNPNYATAHHWCAEHLMWRGRFDDALRESERARQLDPLSLIIATDNGAVLYYSRQYDGAIEKLRAVRELDPSFPRAHGLLVWAYEQKGMFADALADLDERRPVDPNSPWIWSDLAYIYGRTGQQAQARLALGKLEQLNRRQHLDASPTLRAQIGMGNKDQAFAYLEKAYSQHSSTMTTLKVDPLYDPLRGDPRFQDLLRLVGLAR